MDMTAQKPFACNTTSCGMSFTNQDHLTVHEKKHEMALNLGLEQKLNNIFVADQTPTPTRLIKNCEEVGLFDELPNVNPFDETFRRAVEQKSHNVVTTMASCLEPTEAMQDSLHTPQVFALLENTEENFKISQPIETALSSPNMIVSSPESPPAPTDLVPKQNDKKPKQITSHGKFTKYRAIAEKPQIIVNNSSMSSSTIVQLPTAMQLIRPQVVTLSFRTTSTTCAVPVPNEIPVQTVKPFRLSKPNSTRSSSSTTSLSNTNLTTLITPSAAEATCTQLEPSSASLTPTSQLPIKERLKAILSCNSKSKIVQNSQKPTRRTLSALQPLQHTGKYDEDCMERRRAAASRYRNKMKTEHKDLRRMNKELQEENRKLKDLVRELRGALDQKQEGAHRTQITNAISMTENAQIEIPPSTIRLVMNIPKLVIQPSGQPIMKNPVMFALEKS